VVPSHPVIFASLQIEPARCNDSFKEFPPRQKSASFTLDQALDKMASAGTGPSTAIAKPREAAA
jgi:hypothetical protein